MKKVNASELTTHVRNAVLKVITLQDIQKKSLFGGLVWEECSQQLNRLYKGLDSVGAPHQDAIVWGK